jgi:hypothetical protein
LRVSARRFGILLRLILRRVLRVHGGLLEMLVRHL